MSLNRGRKAQALTRIGVVLLLTVSLGVAVPVIMADPIRPRLHPQYTQTAALGVNRSTRNNDEGAIEWTQTYGGYHHDEGFCVEQTRDGGYIITGLTYTYGAGDWDVWLIKTDNNGNLEWNQTYGGRGGDMGYNVAQTADGGYIITGWTVSYGVIGSQDAWLIKTDGNGNAVWNQTYGGPSMDIGYGGDQTADGGYILTGGTESYGDSGSWDVWLIKTDSNGNMVWTQTYGGPTGDMGYGVKQTTDGGYIITGGTESYGINGSWDAWLIKTDGNGNAVWNQTYGGPDQDGSICVQQTADGGYILTGETESFGAGIWDVWLIKTDNNGNVVWTQTYGGPSRDTGWCVAQTTDSGYILTGWTESYGAGSSDVWVIKTDSDGNTEWTQTYGGPSMEESFYVAQTADGGYILTGWTHSYGAGENDMWLLKVSGAGVVTSSEGTETEIVTSPEMAEVLYGACFWVLIVLSLGVVWRGVFAKHKR